MIIVPDNVSIRLDVAHTGLGTFQSQLLQARFILANPFQTKQFVVYSESSWFVFALFIIGAHAGLKRLTARRPFTSATHGEST
jgi:hypothetical protein